MGILQTYRKGFSAIEVLLVLVIAALIGAVGFLVYKNHNKTTTASVATSKTNPVAITPTPTDPISGWKPYANTDGHFTIKYPSTWVSSVCADNIFLLGQSSDALRNCNTQVDSQSQMSVQWWTNTDNPYTAPDKLCTGNGTITSSGSVTVSGISALKIESTYSTNNSGAEGLPGMAEGTKSIQYCLADKQASYRITYMQRHTSSTTTPDEQSVIDNFNSMVTKTFTAN
jgi:prepilin-type N-terminal cleavage/methylation domain-containing protein